MAVSGMRMTEGKTKPPARFTEGTLLSAMENPVKYMESHDKQMAKTLGETGGLGTVATRADIIDKTVFFLPAGKEGGGDLYYGQSPSAAGIRAGGSEKTGTDGRVEMKLSRIAKGQLSHRKFMSDIRDYTVELVDEIKQGEGTFRHDNLTNKICPSAANACWRSTERTAGCWSARTETAATVRLSQRDQRPLSGVPQADGTDRERGGRILVCACGHKERLSKFQERRKKEGAGRVQTGCTELSEKAEEGGGDAHQ